MSTCPNCKKEFDDDFKRYVIGSVTNTIKFSAGMALTIGGVFLGMPFGHHGAHAGGDLGGKIAKEIGCDPDKDLHGWEHECPFCGHRWN